MSNTISFSVADASGRTSHIDVEVRRAFNFGFAGRSREEAEAHVAELAELGFPAPSRVPTIYPINSSMVSVINDVNVRGDQTYGEVEFAVIVGDDSTFITIASDHSDLAIETVSTSRAKTVYPDIISSHAWRLEDVQPHWDHITLTCERLGDDGWKVVQHGEVEGLLSPDSLLQELAERSGEANAPGTVVVSGTIGGEILPGAIAWRNTLTDPVLRRSLVTEYRVTEHPTEI